MGVTAGAVSTEINLVDTTSAKWTAGAPYTDPNNPNFQVRDTQVNVPNYMGRKISLVITGGTDSTFTLDAISTWTNVAWIVKKADSGTGKVKIVPHSGDPNIETTGEYDLPNQFDFVELFTDGTNIYIVGSNA